MRSRLFFVILLTAASALPSAQQATFRATANIVAVDVTVTRGRTPVADLSAGDFRVFDNGVEQTVEALTRGDMPLDVTMVLDFSASNRFDFPHFVTSASSFQQWLRPEDRWRWLGVFGEPRELLAMQPALDLLPAMTRPGPVSVSAIVDTVFLALVRPGEPERRHLVVVFSDGNDNWSVLAGRRIVDVADAADAVLHVVTTTTPPVNSSRSPFMDSRALPTWRDSQNALFDAAQRSGGAIHRIENRAAAFAAIIEQFRTSYVLRYAPKGVDAAGWHELKVSVTRPGSFNVRARKGYERRFE